ncbi:MAG: hypothetical protein K9J06_02050 [Flavobacteriales bacterium]|nr:hypothetical protein [Flavobacteriales bacterium]
MRAFQPVCAFVIVCISGILAASAQNNVGVGTTTPDTSAILDISAQDRGVLVPRTDTLSISGPATGLLIYTPTDSAFWYFDGIYWRSAFGPQSQLPLQLPNGIFGQTLHWDTITNVGWTANSFLWNSGQQIGVNNITPDSSAIVDIRSREMGFLPPRMTEAERDAINNPASGLIVFNLTDSTLDIYNGACWLPSFLQNCDDCGITATPSSTAGTIDRVVADSVQLQVAINQFNGVPQNIAFNLLTQLPAGVTATFSSNPTFGSSTVDVTFHATPFAPAGTFPIVIQVLCGSSTINIIYSLTILPCYVVDAINSVDNYDLSVELYIAHPTAPTNQPVCVVSNINPGVLISSPDVAVPAYTTGNLPAGSLVAIVNAGNIIGKGGDGGDAYDPALGWTGAGINGGTAIDLTLSADIVNNFNIFGGGGGGNALAFAISTGNLIPPPAPAFGFFIGSGGGGGAGGGLGGTQPPGLIGLSWYTQGGDATSGQFGVHGMGGILNFPIPFTVGPAQVLLNPNTIGGNGGPYGYPGTSGLFQLTIDVNVIVNIPFIGNVVIPVVSNLSIPIPVTPPAVGQGGYAVKRNGFTTTIPDNLYNTSFLRGQVGP